MPMPKPKKGQSQSDYMADCMHEMSKSESRTNEQNVAACMQGWRDAHGGEKPKRGEAEVKRIIALWTKVLANAAMLKAMEDAPDVDEGESKQDYIDRCVDELTSGDKSMDEDEAEESCELAYEEYSPYEDTVSGLQEDSAKAPKTKTPTAMMHKTHAGSENGMEFILSDATPDRFGDIVEPAGWDFKSFERNPIALFNHNPSFIVGSWKGLRVQDDALRGKLVLAPKGASQRIDEIRALVEAGILKAVSVGFKPIESKPREGFQPHKANPFGGGNMVYTKSELVETSLVSIPANPNALAVAKSLRISEETQALVFREYAGKKTGGASAYALTRAEHGSKRKSALTAEHGRTRTVSGGQDMLLSERIEKGEQILVQLQDQLQEHLATVDDSNPDDAAMAVTEDLNQKIANAERNLKNLKDAEQRLARAAGDGNGNSGGGGNGTRRELMRSTAFDQRRTVPAISGARPFAFTPKKVSPIEYLIRQGVVEAFAHTRHISLEEATAVCGYGEDECTRAYVDYCHKAATAVGMTSVSGWAAELAQQVYGDFLQLLAPNAVMPALAAKGLALTFGRAGKIVIPARSATPSLAGSFVGEGAPIPVRQGGFSTISIVPKKLGVITTYTRELSEHSIPAIEGILRDSVTQDTSTAIDTVLMDNNAATAIRPPGLRNGVSGLTPTAGGGFAALVGDIKQLAGALLTATAGHIRSGVFLMNPQQVLSISLTQPPAAATSLFPFADEVAAGRLRTFSLIESGNVPVGMVIALDAADFVTAGAEAPRFEVSDQATLHLEDTSPQDITGGTPSPAVPVKSMFQTDSLALRLVWPLNWALRRQGMVAWLTGVTW